MIHKIGSIGNAINSWVVVSLTGVAAFLLVFWTFLMVAGIIGRAFLGWSWLFMEEYTAYFMLTISCLGLAYAARVGANVRVEMVVARLPKRARFILGCICMAVSLWWVVILTQKVGGWFLHAVASGEVSVMTGTLLWMPHLILVIGWASLVLTVLVIFLHAIHLMIQAGNQERTGNGGNDVAGELEKV